MPELTSVRAVRNESGDPHNPTPAELVEIMNGARRVAVVGMSTDPSKPARRIPAFLLSRGYDVVPVNPRAERILGRPALDSLEEVEGAVDMVVVFRPSREAGQVLRTAAARPEEPVIWLQEGITAPEEAREARGRGLRVVQDLCTYKVYVAMEADGAVDQTPRA